jgi:dsRNA-specific ribonuclease
VDDIRKCYEVGGQFPGDEGTGKKMVGRLAFYTELVALPAPVYTILPASSSDKITVSVHVGDEIVEGGGQAEGEAKRIAAYKMLLKLVSQS